MVVPLVEYNVCICLGWWGLLGLLLWYWHIMYRVFSLKWGIYTIAPLLWINPNWYGKVSILNLLLYNVIKTKQKSRLYLMGYIACVYIIALSAQLELSICWCQRLVLGALRNDVCIVLLISMSSCKINIPGTLLVVHLKLSNKPSTFTLKSCFRCKSSFNIYNDKGMNIASHTWVRYAQWLHTQCYYFPNPLADAFSKNFPSDLWIHLELL